jgi:hypothetical protein
MFSMFDGILGDEGVLDSVGTMGDISDLVEGWKAEHIIFGFWLEIRHWNSPVVESVVSGNGVNVFVGVDNEFMLETAESDGVTMTGKWNIEVISVVTKTHSQNSLSNVSAITEDVIFVVTVRWNTDGMWAEMIEIDVFSAQNQVLFKFLEIVFVQRPDFNSLVIEDQESVVESLGSHESEIVNNSLEGMMSKFSIFIHNVDLRHFCVSVGGDSHNNLLGGDDLGVNLISISDGVVSMSFTSNSDWVARSFATGTPDQGIVSVDQNNLIVREGDVTVTWGSTLPGNSNRSLSVSDSSQHLWVVTLNFNVKSITVNYILFLESEKLTSGGVKFDVTDIVSNTDLVEDVVKDSEGTSGSDSAILISSGKSNSVSSGVVSTFDEVKWFISDKLDFMMETINGKKNEVSVINGSLLDLVVHGSLSSPVEVGNTWVGMGDRPVVDNTTPLTVVNSSNPDMLFIQFWHSSGHLSKKLSVPVRISELVGQSVVGNLLGLDIEFLVISLMVVDRSMSRFDLGRLEFRVTLDNIVSQVQFTLGEGDDGGNSLNSTRKDQCLLPWVHIVNNVIFLTFHLNLDKSVEFKLSGFNVEENSSMIAESCLLLKSVSLIVSEEVQFVVILTLLWERFDEEIESVNDSESIVLLDGNFIDDFEAFEIESENEHRTWVLSAGFSIEATDVHVTSSVVPSGTGTGQVGTEFFQVNRCEVGEFLSTGVNNLEYNHGVVICGNDEIVMSLDPLGLLDSQYIVVL